MTFSQRVIIQSISGAIPERLEPLREVRTIIPEDSPIPEQTNQQEAIPAHDVDQIFRLAFTRVRVQVTIPD
jgi:hypothetical protein